MAGVYFAVYTVGELYFSPIGLSLYSKAAPPQVAALMMAVFLATSFPGNFLQGWLGTFYSTMTNTPVFPVYRGHRGGARADDLGIQRPAEAHHESRSAAPALKTSHRIPAP